MVVPRSQARFVPSGRWRPRVPCRNVAVQESGPVPNYKEDLPLAAWYLERPESGRRHRDS